MAGHDGPAAPGRQPRAPPGRSPLPSGRSPPPGAIGPPPARRAAPAAASPRAGRMLSCPITSHTGRFAMPLSPHLREDPAPGTPEDVLELTWEVFGELCRALAV